MRIVQIYDSYRVKGGVERVLSVLMNAWVAQGKCVNLLVRNGPITAVYPLDPTIHTSSLGHPETSNRLRRLVQYCGDVFALRRHPMIQQADIVIANGPWCGLIAILALKYGHPSSRHPKLVICDHNSSSAFGHMTREIGRKLYWRADFIIALTHAQQEAYGAHARNVRLIPNPVVTECGGEFPISPSQNISPTGCNRLSHSVLAMGRLSRQKGFDYLLDAWTIVTRDVPNAHLTLVGEGEEEANLKAQAKRLKLGPTLTFSPFTDDVASAYQAASFLVSSSRFEGLSLVLLEAQTYGLPIVAFDCPYGPREVITQGVDGLLCKAEDTQALANALIRLLRDEAELERMSTAARQASRRYALPTVLGKWEDMFVDLGLVSGTDTAVKVVSHERS